MLSYGGEKKWDICAHVNIVSVHVIDREATHALETSFLT